jgi:hypothetical protein
VVLHPRRRTTMSRRGPICDPVVDAGFGRLESRLAAPSIAARQLVCGVLSTVDVVVKGEPQVQVPSAAMSTVHQLELAGGSRRWSERSRPGGTT